MTTNSTNINDTGLPIFNSTTGLFDAVALTQKGDTLVHNSSNYTRVAVGADEKILTADSTQATGLLWDDISFTGDMIQIDYFSASSSSSVSFTDLDTSTYHSFFIFFTSLHPATDNVSLRCLLSINNGSSYIISGYSYVYRNMSTSTGTGAESHSSSAAYIQCADSIGNASGEGIAGWFKILPSSNASQTRHAIEWQMYSQDTGTNLIGIWGGGTSSTTSAIDAIRLQLSSGNIESGTFYLYGLLAT